MRETFSQLQDAAIALVAGGVIALTVCLIVMGLIVKAVWMDVRDHLGRKA